MPQHRPTLLLGAALTLSLAVQAMDRPALPAPAYDAGERILDGKGFMAQGLACLEGGGVFLLRESAGTCRLLFCRADRAGRWVRQDLSERLPANCAGLLAGPGNTLVAATLDGSLRRLHLACGAGRWRVIRTETLLGKARRQALGLPEGTPGSLAVGPDGAVALGYPHCAVLVQADTESASREAVVWLHDQRAKAAERRRQAGLDGGGDDAPALVVGLDADGVALVLDPASRCVIQVDPRPRPAAAGERKDPSLKKSFLVRPDQWPAGFQPADAVVWGRRLVVAGRREAKAEALDLVAVGPGESVLDLKVQAGHTFAVSPAGHLYVDDGRGQVRRHLNLQAIDEAKATAAERQARAEAVYRDLLREEAAMAVAETRTAPAPREDAPATPPAATRTLDAPVSPSKEFTLEQLAAGTGLRGRLPEAQAPERAPAEPVRRTLQPGRKPAGQVCQRTIADRTQAFARSDRFREAFQAWCQRRGPDLGLPGDGVDPAPAGFILKEPALAQAVRWMLANAHRANPAEEVWAWIVARRPAPRFSFGLFESRLAPGVILEIRDLAALAGAMDAERARATGRTGLLQAELDATGGCTGMAVGRSGRARWVRGVTVKLADTCDRILAIRPGGDTYRVQPAPAAPAPEPPAAQAPVEAKGPGASAPCPASPLSGDGRRFPASPELQRTLFTLAKAFLEDERYGEAYRAARSQGQSLLGAGRFDLGEATLAHVVRWMLANAEHANAPAEVEAWAGQPHLAPRFSFGLYQYHGHPNLTLEVNNLQALAERIDAATGAALAAELAATRGRTGTRVADDGSVWAAHGLAIRLGVGGVGAILPGGVQVEMHGPAGAAGGSERKD